jgi:hypothetical protein
MKNNNTHKHWSLVGFYVFSFSMPKPQIHTIRISNFRCENYDLFVLFQNNSKHNNIANDDEKY